MYFEPKQVTAAIVTCGGLCPGLNDIIQASCAADGSTDRGLGLASFTFARHAALALPVQNIVYMLLDYGVPEEQILGVRYGLRGFIDRKIPPMPLTREVVDGIHLKCGSGGISYDPLAFR